jgi:hypothetical protein
VTKSRRSFVVPYSSCATALFFYAIAATKTTRECFLGDATKARGDWTSANPQRALWCGRRRLNPWVRPKSAERSPARRET